MQQKKLFYESEEIFSQKKYIEKFKIDNTNLVLNKLKMLMV